VYFAPFVVVSHDAGADPLFTYGNQAALELWEMSWEELTQMPSRQAAPAAERAQRARLLAGCKAKALSKAIAVVASRGGGSAFRSKTPPYGISWTLREDAAAKRLCFTRGAIYEPRSSEALKPPVLITTLRIAKK
jgi:MEKHLA domain